MKNGRRHWHFEWKMGAGFWLAAALLSNGSFRIWNICGVLNIDHWRNLKVVDERWLYGGGHLLLMDTQTDICYQQTIAWPSLGPWRLRYWSQGHTVVWTYRQVLVCFGQEAIFNYLGVYKSNDEIDEPRIWGFRIDEIVLTWYPTWYLVPDLVLYSV